MKDNKMKKLKAAELIKQRDKFIEENPELRPVQKQIDNTLAELGDDSDKRAKKMFEHMLEQYEKELSPALNEMDSIKSVMDEIKSKGKNKR